ncbi:MAG: nucleotidyltransferase domain-containing protein [Actinomycetota bacterium]|nr:nucleotidyltransferase domain-containing protein [Actinomycetota bacterium]
MFTVEERDRVRDHMLELARGDARVVAGAEVGSLALGGGDRWSDLDLTFGITDGVAVTEILDDWTRDLVSRFDAVHLFDLVADSTVYRVFLLAEYLQLDVSVAPASKFRSTSPRFKLLFGEANEPEYSRPPSRDHTLGWAVLWARHARICIEREHWWQAEYCITHLRCCGMELACLRHDLPASYGRGFDRLPAEDRDAFEGAIMRSLDRDELLGGLTVGVKGLLRECELGDDNGRIRRRLRELAGLELDA